MTMAPMTLPSQSRQPGDLDLALGALVDEPRHVEPRGLLLGGLGIPVLGSSALGDPAPGSAGPGRDDPEYPTLAERETGAGGGLRFEPVGGFVFSRRLALVSCFGPPDPGLIEELEALTEESGVLPGALTVHVPVEVSQPWCDALGVRPSATLSVQRLEHGDPERWEGAEEADRHVVERIRGADDPRLETIGRGLREDLTARERWPVAFAAMAGGGIASIASAPVETESYFDVSIETERAFRGEGFGRAAALGLIRFQLAQGKAPVWIVKTSNRASLALAASLGFAEAARMTSLRLS